MSRGLAYRRHQEKKAKAKTIARLNLYRWGHYIKDTEAIAQGLLKSRSKTRWHWVSTFDYPPMASENVLPDVWWSYSSAQRDVGFYTSHHGPRGCGHRRKQWGPRERLPYGDRKRSITADEKLKFYQLCEYDDYFEIPELAVDVEHELMLIEQHVQEMHDYLREIDEDPYDDLYDYEEEYEDEEWFDLAL